MTEANDVIRTDTEHMRVNGKWFLTKSLTDAAFRIVVDAGRTAFDMPPWFFTGSPYGDAIIALQVGETAPPQSYRVMHLPSLGYVFRFAKPRWPEIFGVSDLGISS